MFQHIAVPQTAGSDFSALQQRHANKTRSRIPKEEGQKFSPPQPIDHPWPPLITCSPNGITANPQRTISSFWLIHSISVTSRSGLVQRPRDSGGSCPELELESRLRKRSLPRTADRSSLAADHDFRWSGRHCNNRSPFSEIAPIQTVRSDFKCRSVNVGPITFGKFSL